MKRRYVRKSAAISVLTIFTGWLLPISISTSWVTVFLIVDPDKNARDHSGNPTDYRCFWNGVNRLGDVSIGIEIEAWFTSKLTRAQLETSRKLQEVLRSSYVIPDERVLDHKKVASRRGPGGMLVRGRKADGLTPSDRKAIGIAPVLDPDVLRGFVRPNIDEMASRRGRQHRLLVPGGP